MRTKDPLDALKEKGFELRFVSHARSILTTEFRPALEQLSQVLVPIELPISEIIGSGGGETRFTQRLRRSLARLGWTKHIFQIGRTVDGITRESTSHEVDHVKTFESSGTVALEIEWNNKDPFFDRDLENFKRLHVEGAISVGVLITRGASLQDALQKSVARFASDRRIAGFEDLARNGYVPTPKQRANVTKRVQRTKKPIGFAQAWTENFVANKFGQATTHWSKLIHRIERGVGNPCPLMLIGLPAAVIRFDDGEVEQLSEDDVNNDGSDEPD